MNKILKVIIAFIIMWIVVTIFYTTGISYYIGALPGAILLGSIFAVVGYYFFFKSNEDVEPEPEPEPESSSTIGRFTTLIVVYIILVVGIHFLELENTNIGSIILIPGKIFIQILQDFVIPSVEWMFDEVE